MRIKVLSFSEYFYAESKMPLLKNLMQMSTLNIRKALSTDFPATTPCRLVHRYEQSFRPDRRRHFQRTANE